MSTDDIIIGLIIAFFASFAVSLFCVSIYVWLGDRKPAKATTQPAIRTQATEAANENQFTAWSPTESAESSRPADRG